MNVYTRDKYKIYAPSKWDRFVQRCIIRVYEHRKLMKNKLCALTLIAVGALSVFIENDATALVLLLFFAIPLLFAKENWIT